jgi:hypothetical protein
MTSALVRFGAALWALVIPLCLLAPYPVRCFDSLPLSSSPLVRDFPHPSQRSGCLGIPGPRRTHRVKCVINRPQASGSLFDGLVDLCFPVVGVLSSTLLPGFIGPESLVQPADLPRFAPFLFRGRLSQVGFMEHAAISCSRAGALPGVRHTTSSYLVQLQHALVYSRILGLAQPRLLGPRHTPM